MSIRTIEDKILVRVKNPEKTAGAVLLPQDSVKEADQAEIIAINDHHSGIVEADLHVGDQIYFAQFSGDDIEFEGEKLRFIKLEDIYGKVE